MFILVCLLWIGIFFDIYESFTPINQRKYSIHNHLSSKGGRNVDSGQTQILCTSSTTTTTTTTTLLYATSPSASTAEDSDKAADETTSTESKSSRKTTTIVLPAFAPTKTTTTTTPHSEGTDTGTYPSLLHQIHVESVFLLPDEAQELNRIAQEYAKLTGSWNSPDNLRHSSYPTCDFPIDECSEMQDYLYKIQFTERLFGRFATLYDIDTQDMSYLDLFCAHYQAKNQAGNDANDDDDDEKFHVMDRLEEHRDGSLLSFSLLLNSPTEFEGGGTFYDALRDVEPTEDILHDNGRIRPRNAGDIVYHCGKILHGADTITKGSRTVIVGFIDVNEENCYKPGVLKKACTNFGRMDVAKYRYRRQLEKLQKLRQQQQQIEHHSVGNMRLITKKNDKWMPKSIDGGPFSSYIRDGYIPAFHSVERRADVEFQRLRKLEAEDILLRNILLPRNERKRQVADHDNECGYVIGDDNGGDGLFEISTP